MKRFPARRALVALAAAALASGLRAAPAQDLRFGAQTHFAQGWDPAWAATAAATGLGTVRDELYWSSIEASPGQYTFPAEFDAYMAVLQQNHLSPLIELDFDNPNYDGGDTPYDAAGFNGYAAYAAQVLSHYGSQIQAVEIWNEYDGSFCTGPATQNRPATYAQMLETTYARIKAVRPDVTVVAGATAWVDVQFFSSLFSAGALSSLDVLSLHPYRYTSPPEGLENDIASLQDLTRLYNDGQAKPIWVTEIGWYPHAGTGPTDATITDATEAEYAVRAYALLLSAGVDRVYWYLLRDNPEGDNGLDFGLYPESISASPKPAAVAVQTLIAQLAGASFVRRESPAGPLYSLLFQRSDGTQVRVLWATAPLTVYPKGAQSAVDLSGRSLPTTGGLNLGPAPIFVTGPVTGLPGQNAAVLANTTSDFSGSQGANGWTLGSTTDGSGFTAAPTFSLTAGPLPAWTNGDAWFSITDGDQLPSADGGRPVAAVRRWTSSYSGRVEVKGRFAAEQTGGDGVGVSVLVGGKPVFRKLIAGGRQTSYDFDLVETVGNGTTVDFSVDPGPGTDNSDDATAVQAEIVTEP